MKTDKAQKNDGKVVKFGVKQLANDTPLWARYIFRTVLYLSAVYVMAVQPTLDLPTGIEAIINKYIVLLNAVVNVTIKFTGWDFKN